MGNRRLRHDVTTSAVAVQTPTAGLTPEEESLPDADDEYDDTLPADLWFRHSPRPVGRHTPRLRISSS